MTDYAELALVRGMSFLAESQAAVANNLANVESTGFKRKIAIARPEAQAFDTLLGDQLGVVGYRETTDWQPGSLQETGSPLHVAIDGPGHFQVEDGQGRRLFTRNGAMARDARGFLVDGSGRYFLDAEGRRLSMTANDAAAGIRIAPDGTVRAGETTVGRLAVFHVADPTALQPVGHSAWMDTSGRPATPEPNATVRQGQLERSNVDALDELVHMISIQRSFDATAKALSTLSRIKTSYFAAIGR